MLDRSAFYPGGGGQPPDHGVLIWPGVQARIVDTRKGDELYLIPAPGDPVPPPGTAVRGALDDERRSPAGFKQSLEDAVNAEIALPAPGSRRVGALRRLDGYGCSGARVTAITVQSSMIQLDASGSTEP